MLQPKTYQRPNDGLSLKQYEPPETPPITEIVEITGQVRLDELREQYPYEHGFESCVIQAVEQGEIGLLPIGNVVHIKHTDN